MHPVPVKSPWYHLEMEFIGPISPTSTNGNHYILTQSDYFTKFGWAKALPSKEAKNVVVALCEAGLYMHVALLQILSLVLLCFYFMQLFLIMSIPAVMTTDQGREFHNAVNAELMSALGIDHRLTTANHPQVNGLDERYNQTLVNSLSKFVQENRETWDEKLGEVVYAYNMAVQESTR